MIGWVLAALGTTFVAVACSEAKGVIQEQQRTIDSQHVEIQILQNENNRLRLTIHNQQQLLHNYDIINKYAKSIGFKHGAVEFFYYLAEQHDSRFGHFARFLNRVKHIRNEVAHQGESYIIDNNFLKKLDACKYICEKYQSLPNGRRLLLG